MDAGNARITGAEELMFRTANSVGSALRSMVGISSHYQRPSIYTTLGNNSKKHIHAPVILAELKVALMSAISTTSISAELLTRGTTYTSAELLTRVG